MRSGKKNMTTKNYIIIIQFNSILFYLRANLRAQRPITKRARVEKKHTHRNKKQKQENNNNNNNNNSIKTNKSEKLNIYTYKYYK
jgi:hypothetical protein